MSVHGGLEDLDAFPVPPSDLAAGSRVPGRRVLIVEDEALIAMNSEAVLDDAGFSVVGCAATFAQARATAAAARPDVAIVDINLADGSSGMAVAALLARDFGCVVVIATGNPEAVTDEAPVLRVLRKPYDDILLVQAAEAAAAARAEREDELDA